MPTMHSCEDTHYDDHAHHHLLGGGDERSDIFRGELWTPMEIFAHDTQVQDILPEDQQDQEDDGAQSNSYDEK